ncbi:hypothetical protein NHH03_14825 [Stieleria sp. TO1_6]|uniref:hypothetical protein n=1 Tax=Stieleria tagensis TaxID=2956795 RepID=UPI00209B6AFB|nr:hypothetical protein [Stieleria tagensis]MCO8123020.1 hypothetical protein [Stieleria tagensis]
MTITRTIRKRLRRYALLCLVAATTVGGFESSRFSVAADTRHSSPLPSDLCGWVEDLSNTEFGPDSAAANPVTQSANVGKNRSTEILVPQFFAITFSEQLSINTCNYDTWLADTLGNANQTASATAVTDLAAADLAAGAYTAEDLPSTDPHVAEVVEAADLPSTEPPANQVAAEILSELDALAIEQANTPAAVSEPTPRVTTDTRTASSRTGTDFNSVLAVIAASATTGNPIPFGHWTEPFAMIGSAGGDSQITSFQGWFDESMRMITQADIKPPVTKPNSIAVESVPPVESLPPTEFVPLVDFDGQVDAPAMAVVAQADNSDLLRGSSAVIVSIPEAYLPYDLAERDIDPELDSQVSTDDLPVTPPSAETDRPQLVWADGLFSPAEQPFCIRSLAAFREPGWSPLAIDSATADKQAMPAVDPALVDSAERVLVKWADQLRPQAIGRNVASLVVSSDEVAAHMADGLAQLWPTKPAPPEPKPGSGAKLLARAEAAEQLPQGRMTQPVMEQPLAQASATLMQWVHAAQSVFDEVNFRLSDVIEVARNRGTQHDATRRE